MNNKYRDFAKHPEKYLPINDIGDMFLKTFNENYVALRAIKLFDLFERAYQLLLERKCFSFNTAFGEMHPDGYLWVHKHDDVKVIIEQRQSYKYLYIMDNTNFHIRDITKTPVKQFIKQEFEPVCNYDNCNNFASFTYGDVRDKDYVLSMWFMKEPLLYNCEGVTDNTLHGIKSIEYWEDYINNPNELE